MWLLLITLACGTSEPSDTTSVANGTVAAKVFPRAPIVLISIDTLRSDRLPAYGYTGVETPAIDGLVRDGMRFERAFSHYPLTLPSHMSLFTGLLPAEHGVRDNVGYRLGDDVPTLASHLRAAGYLTGGAISAYVLRGDSGIGNGFSWYEDALGLRAGAALGGSQRPGAETVRRAAGWLGDTLEREGNDAPFFLFVHLYDPHSPYDPPAPFATRYADPYDGEIAAADAAVGSLLETLRRLGVYDRSIIVLLSDHGEGLGDHGEQEHGILLYREALQVPLIVKLPEDARAGTTVPAPAQLVDVAPTLTALTGLAPLPRPDGISLLELADGRTVSRRLYAETYYPRLHLGWSELISLIDDDLHFIDGPDPELYDLAGDPTERDNLRDQRRRDYARLRDEVAARRRTLTAPSAVDLETAAQLKALGYLTSASALSDVPLPDPKGQLHELGELRLAFRHFSAGRWADATTAFEQVTTVNPAMNDAWEHLGLSLQRLGRYDEAVRALEKALELTGGADHVALGLARLYLEIGQPDKASSHAELALATSPASAHSVLATIALEAEDMEGVENHARAALDIREGDVGAHILLAQAALLRDDLAAAQQHITHAEAAQAQRFGEDLAPNLRFVAGELKARQGRAAEAEAAFRDEIRMHPGSIHAYTRLAFLHAFAGRSSDATAVLRQLVDTNDGPGAYSAAVETLRALGDEQQAARLLQFARLRFPDDSKLAAIQ